MEFAYRSYREDVRRYIAGTFGAGPPDPEDAVQAAFERFAALSDRARVDNPKAFLIRSARNYVIDQRRRQAVRISYVLSETAVATAVEDRDAERVVSAKERLEIIERTIQTMDPRRQQVVIMNRIHGISCAEIARQLDRSPTLIKALLAEALVLCERALREADGER
ncbi:RNA polymerase sigma factor [Sphingomonas cannabina]|uniref:RNA polymerase sigma factor n=1 Tax=Sphingomonas cannabina TaxID=2899123 RepID=UPI001F423354|nr:RNA polymerase sigma factor [Sphingomonas cannabina]UIJ46288.1 RNA polymerase sigma factor [Sphingomonas cannabina]